MDSINQKRLADSFRLIGNTMFIRMDSVPSLRNGKNINELTISQKKFDSIVLKLTDIIINKKFENISDQEHIEIIRVCNSIYFKDYKENSPIRILLKLLEDSLYDWKLLCKYHWTYSPGMGFHFIELEAELDGKCRTRYKMID
ncbi:MAG: hypothetical protein JNL70_26525 [Saprospiraceae bacterium]|nr:hypothetical protein [Saprospiraceae bacterium]